MDSASEKAVVGTERSKAQLRGADIPLMSPLSGVSPLVSPTGAVNSGLDALASSNRRLSQDAQQIANPDNQSLTNPLLDASQSLLLAEAGAAIIRTSDRMLGSLLNVFA
jgi:hypothetical protein